MSNTLYLYCPTVSCSFDKFMENAALAAVDQIPPPTHCPTCGAGLTKTDPKKDRRLGRSSQF